MSLPNDIENQINVRTYSHIGTNGKNTEINNSDSNKKECLECCGICCLSISSLALIGCVFSYVVFGIIFLVKDYDVAKSCNISLWAYVLTAIVLSVMRSKAKSSSDEKDKLSTICNMFCLGLIETGLAIWGGLELWDKSCDDLKESGLWTFGLVTFCLQVICASLFLVIAPLSFLICCLCNKEK